MAVKYRKYPAAWNYNLKWGGSLQLLVLGKKLLRVETVGRREKVTEEGRGATPLGKGDQMTFECKRKRQLGWSVAEEG